MLINKIFHFLRAKRREIATGIFIFFVASLGIYYLFFEGRGNQNRSADVTPTPEQSTEPINTNRDSITIEQNNYSFNKEPYLLYQVRTKSNVLGYGWSNGKLLYANPEGIFEARVEVPLLDQKISSVNFNMQGKALVRAGGNNWYVFENGKDLISLPTQGANPQLSQNGDYVLSLRGNKLTIYSLTSKNTNEIELEGNGLMLKTSGSSPYALTLSENGSERRIELIDINQQKRIDQLSVSENSDILGISPSGSKIMFKSDNQIILRSRRAGEKDIRYQLSDNANYQGYFLDDDRAILIERRPKDTQYQSGQMYLLDTREEKKEFLVDDKQMIQKVNPNVPIFLSSQKTAFAVAENNGTLWLISLTPGKIANYSRNSGLQLFDNVFDPGSFEDNH